MATRPKSASEDHGNIKPIGNNSALNDAADHIHAGMATRFCPQNGNRIDSRLRRTLRVAQRCTFMDDLHPGIFDPRAGEREVCMTTKDVEILAYKARPLDGIWATAPYLHNGSVASLHELLLPAEERKKEFWVGNRAFDTAEVGYVDAEPANGQAFRFKASTDDGTVIEGNGNQGHEYGAANFSDEDRKAIVEYLKSL